MIIRSGLGLALAVGILVQGTASTPRFHPVLALKRDEGVFAYARISPDGQVLAYASESRVTGKLERTVTVVDLSTGKVLFSDAGIDAYWSTDGRRMIYLGLNGPQSVNIRDQRTGLITRGIAPPSLGDYFSWGWRDGKNLILTINARYYYLEGNTAVLPAAEVQPCDGIGVGDRPLLSKDGRRITTFVGGTVVIRGLTDCGDIIDTGIRGAKADFSWDGRYVALHAPKPDGSGFLILVVDLQRRTVRTVTDLPGSSFFPSWTRDGRLCFRYDGDDYRGFMIADRVLAAPERPLPQGDQHVPVHREWADIFPETSRPPHRFNLVTVWGPWSAHSPDVLRDVARARRDFDARGLDIDVSTATDPGSRQSDVDGLLERYRISVPRIPLAGNRFASTEAANQNPTTLLFHDGVLVDSHLGPQTFDELRRWVSTTRLH
jgi:WD40-like Beta Propeller Repeat